MDRRTRHLPGLHSAEILTLSTTEVATYFVRLQFDGGAPPLPLIESLEAIAFRRSAAPIHQTLDPHARFVVDFGRQGSGVFGAWTKEEGEHALNDLARVFAAHGLRFAPRPATYYERL